MRIISTTDRTVTTTDCTVYNNISLIEKFDIYSVIIVEKVTGIIETSRVSVPLVTRDMVEAIDYYRSQGGKFEKN